jgi:hypothetical protein
MEGVRVLKQKGYGVKLEVDTDTVAIETVMAQLLARYSIVDINIDNPPMEEIIVQIYQAQPETTPAPHAGDEVQAPPTSLPQTHSGTQAVEP